MTLTITFITDITPDGPVHYPIVFDTDTDNVYMLNIYGDVILVFDPVLQVFKDKEMNQLLGHIHRAGTIFSYIPNNPTIEGFKIDESKLKDTHQGNVYIDFEVALAGHFLGTGKYDLAIKKEDRS